MGDTGRNTFCSGQPLGWKNRVGLEANREWTSTGPSFKDLVVRIEHGGIRSWDLGDTPALDNEQQADFWKPPSSVQLFSNAQYCARLVKSQSHIYKQVII